MIPELIERARRRYLRNEVLAQAANALTVAMGGVIVLLLAGTQLLDWPVLLAVILTTCGLVIYRTARRLPSSYRIAQVIDQRLKLADTLSTALYYSNVARRENLADDMRAAQAAQAESVARQADIVQALPLVMPRAVYAVAALGLVASGLFALRYGLERRIELRAPLARILMDRWGMPGRDEAALHKKNSPKLPDSPKPLGISMPEAEAKDPGQLDPASDSALDTVGVPDAVNNPLAKNEAPGKSKAAAPGDQKAEGEPGDSEGAESAEGNPAESAANAQGGEKQGSKNAANKTGQSSNGEGSENSSVMSKVKEMMSNLLSRVRQQPSGSGSQRPAQASQNQRQAKNGQTPGQKGASNQGQPGARESGDSEGQQAPGEGENGQSAEAKAGGRSSEQQSVSQPGSGIGSQDGNKDTKLAEQLAAMGKISEIIGKRSANVTGEVTVEVQSSQQQLRTQYTRSTAVHSEAGGDINRDEVPVVFQQFVQEYFDQVRKQPTAVTSKRGEPTQRGKAQPAGVAPPTL